LCRPKEQSVAKNPVLTLMKWYFDLLYQRSKMNQIYIWKALFFLDFIIWNSFCGEEWPMSLKRD